MPNLTVPAAATGLPIARQEHAACLRLAALYRSRAACGDRAARHQHAWAIQRCRSLRIRFVSLSVEAGR